MRIMTKLGMLIVGVLVAGAATAVTVGVQSDSPPQAEARAEASPPTVYQPPAYAPAILKKKSVVDKPMEERVMMSAAQTAWTFVDNGYNETTGFVITNPGWPYPTVWDVASGLGSFYSARGLGLITEAEYKKRTMKTLETLAKARLFENVAYGRNYDARTGELIGLDQKPSQNGTGYSAIDLGRLLVWLKIVSATDPEIAALAQQVALRMDAKRIIRGGYLFGEQITKEGHFKYQEGRLSYEQYAATGFALWGMKADGALKMAQNVRKVNVMGIPLWADKRGLDRLLSEPFIMHGLEVGFQGEMQELAWQTLSLQAKRYEETGQITIASEDALADKPHYFYYYCVYCSGKAFTINIHKPGLNLDQPRWISSKAAFAWYALMPSVYTWRGIKAVEPAQHKGKGWATGVYEKTGKTTDVFSLNTSALILESALYYKTGKPFLQGT